MSGRWGRKALDQSPRGRGVGGGTLQGGGQEVKDTGFLCGVRTELTELWLSNGSISLFWHAAIGGGVDFHPQGENLVLGGGS